MIAELIEVQEIQASEDRIWCVAWNPTGTLYGSILFDIRARILIVF